jgi:hypothetical protein
MAVLSIRWENASRVSPAERPAVTTPSEEGESADVVATGGSGLAPADKPMFVLVAPADASSGFDKIEKVILTDDKIAIGANAFRCIRLTPEQADEDPLLAGKGRAVPRILLVSADWSKVTVLDKPSVSGTFNAMKAEARRAYKADFDKNVRAMLKVLGEFDKIANERNLLEQKERREANPNKAFLADIAKSKADLDEREALLDFQPRAAAA